MSRPKPRVLLTHTHHQNYLSEQVLQVSHMFAVCYDGRPINLKQVHSLLSDQTPKYRRTCFPESPGHALNLADKLNVMFKTDRFSVWEMQPVKKVSRST